METNLIQHRTKSIILRSRATRSAGFIILATAGALAVWAIAVPFLGTALTVSFGPSPVQVITPAAVAATAAGAGLVGWGLLATLTRVFRNGRTLWTATAMAVLLLSLAGPLTAGTTVGVKAALALMHLVVAAVLVTSLPRWTGPREPGKAASPAASHDPK